MNKLKKTIHDKVVIYTSTDRCEPTAHDLELGELNKFKREYKLKNYARK
jgi:hypothetical protein